MAPRNRKERRAAGSAESIPLARPSRETQASNQNAKTLYQIAAERQGVDVSRPTTAGRKEVPKTEFVHISPSGGLTTSGTPDSPKPDTPSTAAESTKATANDGDSEGDNEVPIPPLPDTILFSFPLSMLNFTLSLLAAHQFAQDIPLRMLTFDAVFVTFPALTFLIHLLHGHIITLPAITVRNKKKGNGKGKKNKTKNDKTGESEMSPLKALFAPTSHNFFFLAVSIFLGTRLIAISNDARYYAVMKKAPPIGTLWVWCVLEMSPGFAALGLLAPMSWAVFYKGYGIF